MGFIIETMPSGKLLSRVLLTVAAGSAVVAVAAVALRAGRGRAGSGRGVDESNVQSRMTLDIGHRTAESEPDRTGAARQEPAATDRPPESRGLEAPPTPAAVGATHASPLPYPGDVAHVNLLLDMRADDTARNEAGVALRRAKYAGLADDLVRVLDNPEEKERFRSFAMQHLGVLAAEGRTGVYPPDPEGRRWVSARTGGSGLLSAEASAKAVPPAMIRESGPEGPSHAAPADRGQETAPTRILDVLRRGLDDRQVAVRREALLALVRLRDPEAISRVERLMHDAGPEADAARDLAIRCVQELDLREYIPLIRRYAGAGSRGPFDSAQGKLEPPLDAEASADAKAAPTPEVVRIAAIVALSQWGDEESRPAFEVGG